MDFNTLLNNFPSGAPAVTQTKVASVDNSKQQLANAVEATKYASASPSTDAVEALMKTAAMLAENEKTAEEVHAYTCGRAFAEGSLSVYAAADAAAQKWAGENEEVVSNDIRQLRKDLTKDERAHEKKEEKAEEEECKEAAMLGYQETMMKAAADQGYQETMMKAAADQGYQETMMKAAADYEQGREAAINDAVKVAADEFMKGSLEAMELIKRARAQ